MIPDVGPITGGIVFALVLAALVLTILTMLVPPRWEPIVAEVAALVAAGAIVAVVVVLVMGPGNTP